MKKFQESIIIDNNRSLFFEIQVALWKWVSNGNSLHSLLAQRLNARRTLLSLWHYSLDTTQWVQLQWPVSKANAVHSGHAHLSESTANRPGILVDSSELPCNLQWTLLFSNQNGLGSSNWQIPNFNSSFVLRVYPHISTHFNSCPSLTWSIWSPILTFLIYVVCCRKANCQRKMESLPVRRSCGFALTRECQQRLCLKRVHKN